MFLKNPAQIRGIIQVPQLSAAVKICILYVLVIGVSYAHLAWVRFMYQGIY